QQQHKPKQARTTLSYLIDIYPENQQVHRRLGDLLLAAGNTQGAIREYRAVLDLHPDDTAQAHYDLARALFAAHHNADAKNEVIDALETAPDFRPAQKLLLELSN
ncbi:MAG: tetratricopeptide repeat protein, partial [Bryobacteraceae bacterium]